jgi:hypothetical protein
VQAPSVEIGAMDHGSLLIVSKIQRRMRPSVKSVTIGNRPLLNQSQSDDADDDEINRNDEIQSRGMMRIRTPAMSETIGVRWVERVILYLQRPEGKFLIEACIDRRL